MCTGGGNKNYGNANLKDPNYKGEAVDPSLKDGPDGIDRGCTDILCCIIFIAFLCGAAFVVSVGFANGDLNRLTAMYDANGRACGIDEGVKDYPLLYFFAPMPGMTWKTVCVKKCPSVAEIPTDQTKLLADWYADLVSGAAPPNKLDCATIPGVIPHCYGTLKATGFDMSDVTAANSASMQLIYSSTTMFNKLCYPAEGQSIAMLQVVQQQIQVQTEKMGLINTALSDIDQTKYFIMASALIALVVGMIWMVVMKMCAAVITWTALAALVGCSAYVTYLMKGLADDRQKQIDAVKLTEEEPQNYHEMVYFLCIAITALEVLTILCLFNKIRLAIRIMQTAADFVTECFFVLLVPPFFSLVTVGWAAVWVYFAMYVYTMGTWNCKAAVQTEQTFYCVNEWSQTEQAYFLYWLFAYLWINAFLQALNTFILASSAAVWYFSPRDPENESDKLVKGAVRKSFWRCFRYHMGTMAFGSFILAVVQFVRLVLAYVQQKLKQSGAEKNKLIEYAICVCQSCLECFERVIKFINKNAYINCAVAGNNFCYACKESFFLILRNAFLFAISGGLGDIFTAFGKLFITAVTVLASYFMLDYQYGIDNPDRQISNIYGPLLLIGIIAFCVGSSFMTVWGMGADTILQCFCIDKELNKGGKNDYCPKQLHDFMDDPKLQEQAKAAQEGRDNELKHYNAAQGGNGGSSKKSLRGR